MCLEGYYTHLLIGQEHLSIYYSTIYLKQALQKWIQYA